ncbi:MAG: ATP-dependent RNA helicase [Prosthecobacter sp.]|nr:ATP-dependent RNA helicase [Prosthecobacter sp.]
MPAKDSLPIFEIRDTVLHHLQDGATPNLLLKAPTGSGKSTQVPQFVLDSGILAEGQRCVVLQPRRIAARMLAQRVARERGGRLGGEVGYQVRFDNVTSRDTRLTYVTEGVMLRQLMEDPNLSHVGCVVIDEFHERHLDGDLVLAWARALQQTRRPELRIIVMSATLVPGPLTTYMQPVRLLESQGRTYPVQVRYQTPNRDLRLNQTEPIWDQAARACEGLTRELGEDGDILVFMPGAYEIRKTITALQGRAFSKGRLIVSLHGEMTPQDQDAAVTPGTQPKIIVSTNVAETSLTIEGVKAVVDSGLARVASYDPRRGLNTLTVQKISRASAEQRAGRAGRLGPGIAIRLWAEREHTHRVECELPEIQRLELSEALLALHVAQEKAGLAIEWFEKPSEAALTRAQTLLHDLGAFVESKPTAEDTGSEMDGEPQRSEPSTSGRPFTATYRLSPTGQRMAVFPTHPRFARMLLAAADYGCVREAAMCAALAQGREILMVGKNQSSFRNEEFWENDDISEFQALLRAFIRAQALNFDPTACAPLNIHALSAREAGRSNDQYLRIAQRAGLPIHDEVATPESLARTLLAAFSDHLGIETSSGSRIYRLPGGYSGHLGKDAHIKPPRLLVAAEITEVQGKALTVQLNLVTRVEEDWLRSLFPADFTTARRAHYDSVNRRVVNLEEVRFRSLVLSSRERGEPDASLAASLLADEVMAGRLQLPLWNEKVEQWITRVNCLSRWMPELEIPPITEDDRRLLIEQLCEGCTTYRQLKDRDIFPALYQWLSHAQRDLLERYAPERLPLKNGRSVRIEYDEKQPPSISVVLQQLYDVHENPKIAGGRITVIVHLLSPAQRPIQTTGDLGRFWKESYPAVKAQLRGRYPKHEWR